MQRHQFCSPSEAFDPVETRLTNNVNPVITTNEFDKWSKESVLAFKVRRTIQWFAYRSGYGLQMLSLRASVGCKRGPVRLPSSQQILRCTSNTSNIPSSGADKAGCGIQQTTCSRKGHGVATRGFEEDARCLNLDTQNGGWIRERPQVEVEEEAVS